MKSDLTQDILELIRLTSTDLPLPVEKRLREGLSEEETGSPRPGSNEDHSRQC